VLDQLGADPGDATMVGDSWERDVVGARRVGMRAVWIANGRPSPEPVDPDNGLWVIDHIGGLPDVFA
jgi:putative hydrolase of the HAD superfamily